MSTEGKRVVKDELRDDAVGVFFNSDARTGDMDLTDPDVSVEAFRAVFSDIAEIQTIPLSFK